MSDSDNKYPGPKQSINPELDRDLNNLSSAASQAIAQQLVKGQQKGYSDWQNASTFTLAMKAIKAATAGNWASVIAYGAMLLWQWQQAQND